MRFWQTLHLMGILTALLACGASYAAVDIPITQIAGQSAFQATPIAVFGKDDRGPLPRNLQALAGSVGLVASDSERTLCSGFCVGRRTVATAAHCLFRTAGERRPDIASFQFIVGRLGRRRAAGITGRENKTQLQHVIAGSTTLNVSPPIDATRDWALMRLAKPVCGGNSLMVEDISPVRIDRLAARGRLLNVAFVGDRNDWQLTVSPSCRTNTRLGKAARRQLKRDFTDVASLVLHECDTGLASSGSPLLALAPDNTLRVVAINIGTYQQTRYLVTRQSVKRRYKPATVANTAVSGSQFAKHLLAFTRADIMTRQADIRRLQRALGAAGYKTGAVDGIFGERTRAAVIEFERATGRAPVGIITPQLLRDIKSYRER